MKTRKIVKISIAIDANEFETNFKRKTMDTEFNINTQKSKNKLLGVVQTEDSLQTILKDRKNN